MYDISVVVMVGVFCRECFSQNSSAPKCVCISRFSFSIASRRSFSLANRCCSKLALDDGLALDIPENADNDANESDLVDVVCFDASP